MGKKPNIDEMYVVDHDVSSEEFLTAPPGVGYRKAHGSPIDVA
jgi:hypothetical protein